MRRPCLLRIENHAESAALEKPPIECLPDARQLGTVIPWDSSMFENPSATISSINFSPSVWRLLPYVEKAGIGGLRKC
jgi:hypothetical protein